jgi:hypothetical protein
MLEKPSGNGRVRAAGALYAVLMTCLVPFACSKDDDGISNLPQPCMGATCGKPCSTTASCDSGYHCNGTTCTQECAPGSATCGAGKACSQDGRCVTTGSGTAGNGGIIPTPGGGGTGGGGEPDACAAVSVEFESEVPNVLLLVDQSGSMADDLESGLPRWTAVRDALIDPTNGFVSRMQALVNFGLTLYTGPNGRGQVGVGMPADGCPFLTNVPIAANNFTAIQTAYLPVEMDDDAVGETPTGESLAAVTPAMVALDPAQYPGRRVIVLATDGEPDTCANRDESADARRRSVDAARAAFEQDVTVYVISVGDDVGEDHLREVANAGQGFPNDDPTARFYRAVDAAQLEMAFLDIINGVRSCVFALEGEVTGEPSRGMVTVDGTPVAYDDPNGWRLNGPSEVEILGSTCETIKMGDRHEIDIRFQCNDIVIVPK